jgi:protein phosphatase
MIKIPLHCLVVLVGTAGCGKTHWALCQFPASQVLSSEQLTENLTGRADNQLHKDQIWKTLVKQTEQRLAMGNRVVVDHSNLHRWERDAWIAVAEQFGVMCVFVLVDQPLEHKISEMVSQGHTQSSAKTLLSFQEPYYQKFAARQHSLGPSVRVVKPEQISVVRWPTLANQTRLLAVGDVHGNHSAMKRAVSLAQEQERMIVWLGDVVDYGPCNLRCAELAYHTVNEGQAVIIWGNHERKIGRWLASHLGYTYRGKLSEANRITVREIEALDHAQLTRFLAAWTALENWSQQVWECRNWLFSHGAADPLMIGVNTHRLPQPLGDLAMYGEVSSSQPVNSDGYPNRTWNWIDKFDASQRVVVGHDWLDRMTMSVVEKTGSQGAKIYCVDTGSSKGGVLSALAIDVDQDRATVHRLE